MALTLVDLYSQELEIESELMAILSLPKFEVYRTVFNRFQFGNRFQAVLLGQIYPIEGFLGDDLKPIVIERYGKVKKGNSRNVTKRHLSLRRFTKAVGLAPSESSSGRDSHGMTDHGSRKGRGVKAAIVGGSDVCRKHFWLWHFTQVEPIKNRQTFDIGIQVWEWEQSDNQRGKPKRLLRLNGCCYASKLLFKALVAEIAKQPTD
jgi:hypothetical protein